jgi:hypothetical protein
MIQRNTLNDPQRLDELRCNGLGLVLFFLWIRGEEKGQKPGSEARMMGSKKNSRSRFVPLLNSTSRYPVAEVIHIRSLEGTVHEERLTESVDAEVKRAGGNSGELTIKG